MALITTPDSVLKAALEANTRTADPRLKEIVDSLTRHLHAFVVETRLTEAEFERGLEFLVAIGQATGQNTNEVVLAADILGVSSAVALQNNEELQGESSAALLGPFWRDHAPECAWGDSISRSEISGGIPMEVHGTIQDESGRPISDVLVDVWQSAPTGLYENQDPSQQDMNLRGRFRTNDRGEFFFRTVRPAGYPVPTNGPCGDLLRAQNRHPNRPAHIHFMFSKPGYKVLITQVFDQSDENIQSDPVFGVSRRLLGQYELNPEGSLCSLRHTFTMKAGEMVLPHPPIP